MKKIFSAFLILFMTLSCILGFGGCTEGSDNIDSALLPSIDFCGEGEGGCLPSEKTESGVTFVTRKLDITEYDSYSVLKTAESAYSISVSVKPEDTLDKRLSWSISWTNEGNEWSFDKTVTDYMIVEDSDDGAVVSCLQAFGAQISVTACLVSDQTKFATCTFDYAQKVLSAKLNFGTIPVVLGGTTEIIYEISTGVVGPGGLVSSTLELSDVYTLSETFTHKVAFDSLENNETVYFRLSSGFPSGMTFYSRKSSENAFGKEIYFDYDHDISDWFIMRRQGDLLIYNLSASEIAAEFDGITESRMYVVYYDIVGLYSAFSYSSLFECVGYTQSISS